MRAICWLFKHRASRAATWNGGFNFSRCARCRHDLVLLGGKWSLAPRGYRVVWKKRTERDIDWSRWNDAPGEPVRQQPLSIAELATALRIVGDAPERRNPWSAGLNGEGDRRRAA